MKVVAVVPIRRALGIRGAGYVESGAWVESGSL
jgi:hypothetical protein